jgi:hypothetical protein
VIDVADVADVAGGGAAGSAVRSGTRYLARLDALVPRRICGFYLVGSVALGAFVEGRSDVDFVAVVDDDLSPSEVGRLRRVQARSGIETAVAALRRGHSPLTGTCNGIFVTRRSLSLPVSEITPIASHVGFEFHVGKAGSDVSPVGWKVLQERGVALRGPEPSSLPLDPQPALLTSWNLGNLDSYWRPWATAVRRAPGTRFFVQPRWTTAWGMLGAPRLHCTIATGAVVSKEAAGAYALDLFAPRWHGLIGDALAHRRLENRRVVRMSPAARGRAVAEFVFEVIASAAELRGEGPPPGIG